jgi:hypothetical protein
MSVAMNRCILLSIDSGATSGAAIMRLGIIDPTSAIAAERRGVKLLKSRTIRTPADRAEMIEESRAAATEHHLPIIVLAEKWAGSFRGKRGTTQTVTGLGASWGRWSEALDIAKVSRRRIARVWSGTWRARVIGGSAMRRSEQWKTIARGYVKSLFGVEVDDDEAEAILVGFYGLHAPEVEKILNPPKRTKPAETPPVSGRARGAR